MPVLAAQTVYFLFIFHANPGRFHLKTLLEMSLFNVFLTFPQTPFSFINISWNSSILNAKLKTKQKTQKEQREEYEKNNKRKSWVQWHLRNYSICLNGQRIWSSMIAVGVLFGKENMPNLLTWMHMECPQCTVICATEHSSLSYI